MTEQRFTAGAEPRVRITRVRGDLQVEVWDEEAILVDADGKIRELYQEGDELVLDGVDGDVELRVPARTTIIAARCDGEVAAEGVRRVELERVGGDAELSAIAEEVVFGSIGGDLSVAATPALRGSGAVGGDAELRGVGRIILATVGGDLEVEGAASLSVERVDGDLDVDGLAEQLGAATVGGDLSVDGIRGASVHVGHVGGDVSVDGDPAGLQLGNVGGDCELDGDCERVNIGGVGGDLSLGKVGELRVGSVGGDLEVEQVSALAEIGSVSGDAELTAVECPLELGSVGGDLDLRAGILPASRTRARVGGDAAVELLGEPSLTLTAVVGGEVRGVSASSGDGQKRISLVYGTGEASLDLAVGGDLRISGARPTSSSASSSSGAGAGASFGAGFGRDWAEFGREMGELGRELGRLGREIGDEIAAALAKEGVTGGAAWGEEAARKMEAAARKMEEKARKMEEKARRSEGEPRVRVKINEREWQLDPERLERIKEQARRAAAEGLTGAIEAVERALGRMRVPPAPGAPPPPPAPGAPPAPQPPATGQTIRIDIDHVDTPAPDASTAAATAADAPIAAPAPSSGQPVETMTTPTPSPDVERERETILRMIAEGRISPEEGDLLLEALN